MRKSISTAFFSMVSTLMVLGIVLMGCSEWVLFKNYFAKDRYETLDQVVNVAKRTAEYLVNSETMPQGAELDALNTKLEIIGESAEAYLFFTDRQGNVLIASDPDKLTTGTVPLDICQRANAVADPDARHYHAFGDLGGALTEKSYIADYSPEEKKAFLAEMGIEASGLDNLITASYDLLGLISFLTDGKKECRAWTIRKGTKAPQAAGKIHSDFERGFIRASVIGYNDLEANNFDYAAVKAKGLQRTEGKEYVVHDGDVIEFLFNV